MVTTNAKAPMMDAGRATWDEKTTKTFLDLCIAEKEKRNYNSRGLTKIGWQNVYHKFHEETGKVYCSKKLQNKFATLKRMYKVWMDLKDKTGGGWNKNTGTVSMDPELWDQQIGDNSDAEQFRNRTLAFQDELTTLFGSMHGDSGTILCVGGYGDRTSSQGSKENLDRSSEDIFVSEDNVGRSGVGRVSERPKKEQVVDSPPPKKPKSVEYYVQQISESMLERSRNVGSAISREQEEVTDLLHVNLF